MQLPLEQQKALFDLSTYAVVRHFICVNWVEFPL